MSDDGLVWPECYVDPDTGDRHGWDDPVAEVDELGRETGQSDPDYTYRDLAYDQAEYQGLGIAEYLETTGATGGFSDELEPPVALRLRWGTEYDA